VTPWQKVRLPQDAIIDRRKVTDYLLRSREEDDKSAFLARLGYLAANADQLLADIRIQILPLDAESLGSFDYGIKYRIRAVLRGPNGRELPVVSIWAKVEKTGLTRFITLYPDTP